MRGRVRAVGRWKGRLEQWEGEGGLEQWGDGRGGLEQWGDRRG